MTLVPDCQGLKIHNTLSLLYANVLFGQSRKVKTFHEIIVVKKKMFVTISQLIFYINFPSSIIFINTVLIFSSDIGNRITELSKAVTRIHSDMKVIQQLLVDDGHIPSDALTKDGSSILGKYIIGAKNNFRGFNYRQEEKAAPLKVTVHHEEEEVDKETVTTDTKQESELQHDQTDKCGAEGSTQVTDCDVVKMEEGRARAETEDGEKSEKEEQVEADNNENTHNKVREEGGARVSFANVEEKVKGEVTQDEPENIREEEFNKGAKVDEKHTEAATEPAEINKVSSEKSETKKLVNRFKEIELQEKKVEPRWMKGRKFDHNAAEKSGVRESNDKPGVQKNIPSPTGSSSSQDTGFGSQEGEGSIDGTLVSP